MKAPDKQGHPVAQYQIGQAYGVGQGFEQDYVQAHMWVNLSAASGYEIAIERRDVFAKLMTPEQIAEAQRLARDWRPQLQTVAE